MNHTARITNEIESLTPKQTAATIRTILKAVFPACKFSVRTARGSMVSSVDISWTDGPTVARVEEFTSPFQAGHFDGMTDCYEYDRNSAIEIDGKVYRAGTRYVFERRTISPALAAKCIQQIAAYWGLTDLPTVKAGYAGGFQLEGGAARVRPVAGNCSEWYEMIHRAANDATVYAPRTGGR